MTKSTKTHDVHIDNGNTLRLGEVTITFQRTLRIPDSGKTYPLPPGLGTFPIRRVADFADTVPEGWAERGGVFLPMYQREAMWLSFGGTPHALKVGIGKVCAISGERWNDELEKKPQNYVVVGQQPWLDGIASGKGTIRQFVAMPLGRGLTVEGQVTGEERFGGIQLQVHAPRPGTRAQEEAQRRLGFADECATGAYGGGGMPPMACAAPVSKSAAPRGGAMRRRSGAGSMGLAAGGKMKQKIYPDPYGVDTWEEERDARVFVHIVNSQLWREITGEEPPKTPVTAKSYAKAKLPWFDLYDEDEATVKPTATLKQVKSLGELEAEQGIVSEVDDSHVHVGPVKKLWKKLSGYVEDGTW